METKRTKAWSQQLRVEWTKDGDTLCQTQVTNGSLSVGVCGPRGWLSWQQPGNLTLQLDPVSLNDSGLYVCWATVEIPGLEEAQGNGTQLLVETDGSLLNQGVSGELHHVTPLWPRPPGPPPIGPTTTSSTPTPRTFLRAAGDRGCGRCRFCSRSLGLGPLLPSA